MKTRKICALLFIVLFGGTSAISAQTIAKSDQYNHYYYEGQLHHYNDLGKILLSHAQKSDNLIALQAYQDYNSSKRLLRSSKTMGLTSVIGMGVGGVIVLSSVSQADESILGPLVALAGISIGGTVILAAVPLGIVSLVKYSKGRHLKKQSIDMFNDAAGLYGFDLPKEKGTSVKLDVISKDGLGLRLTF